MAFVYVAKSAGLQKWAGDVGLTKHVYLVGVAGADADQAVAALNAEAHAGFQDWKLLRQRQVETADEDAVIAALARKEKQVDPNFYPRLKGTRGLFKIKPVNVESHLLVKKALAGEHAMPEKITSAVVADYLIAGAVGSEASEAGEGSEGAGT